MQELGIIKRQPTRFHANRQRVLGQFFDVGGEQRIKKVLSRVLSLSPKEVTTNLSEVLISFAYRHRDFKTLLKSNFNRVAHFIDSELTLTNEQQLLIGSYFTKEYSLEAAALFNPSMVPHPDQSGLDKDQIRYVMSFRATGEGHISSVEFSTGVVHSNGDIIPDTFSPFTTNPEIIKMQHKEAEFTFNEITDLSERAIFPITPDECNGIEDVRLVRFQKDNGTYTYYGSYTAYDGYRIQPKLLETSDFMIFKTHCLNGPAAQNKGMALFPQKINGKYTMISRQDGENIYIMFSHDLLYWDKADLVQEPEHTLEFVQLGNCGSPIETDAGWLLLSHSVGAMRQYVMSAYLLDKQNPAKIIGSLPHPLLIPNESERDGYVPNVVYSCGSMKFSNNLIIPYAMSDNACGFATAKLDDIIKNMI